MVGTLSYKSIFNRVFLESFQLKYVGFNQGPQMDKALRDIQRTAQFQLRLKGWLALLSLSLSQTTTFLRYNKLTNYVKKYNLLFLYDQVFISEYFVLIILKRRSWRYGGEAPEKVLEEAAAMMASRPQRNLVGKFSRERC